MHKVVLKSMDTRLSNDNFIISKIIDFEKYEKSVGVLFLFELLIWLFANMGRANLASLYTILSL